MEQKADIKKNVLWNTIGSVFYCVCQWAITILVVRIESYEASGYLSLAMTTSSSFSAISLFSMRNFQVSDVNEEYSSREYYGSRIVTCVVAQLLCMVYACVMAKTSNNFWCITIFMMVRIAEALVDVFHGINQKFDKYDLIGKSFIIRGILTVVSFSLGLFLTHNLIVTLAIMALLNILVVFLYDMVKTGSLESIKPVIFDKHVFQLVYTCVPLVIFTFLLSMQNLIPKNLLESIHGTDELGIYASIASPTLVVQVMASVIFNPFLPQFTRLYTDGKVEEFRKMFHKILFALVAMSFVIIIGANLFGRLGLKILFGEMILEHYYLFNPIVCCTILVAMIWIVSSIVIAMRQLKSLLVGITIDFTLCVIVAKPLVDEYGKNGVSIVQIISYSVMILYMIIVCEITIIKKKKDTNYKI